MQKQVQIDLELFRQIINYFIEEAPESDEAKEIRKKLDEKLDKMINRDTFTKYKRAATAEERERYRKEYLDRRGMLPDFRTETEYRVVPPEDLKTETE